MVIAQICIASLSVLLLCCLGAMLHFRREAYEADRDFGDLLKEMKRLSDQNAYLGDRTDEAESALVRKCEELKQALDEIASLNAKLIEEQDASRALAAGLVDEEERTFVRGCMIDDLAIAIKDARAELGSVLCDLDLCDCECRCDCEAGDESIEDACRECDDRKADDSQGFTGCTASGPPPSAN